MHVCLKASKQYDGTNTGMYRVYDRIYIYLVKQLRNYRNTYRYPVCWSNNVNNILKILKLVMY